MKTSTQGYKTNSPDNKEKALLIPSNKISMENTIHEEIYAVPFKGGKAQKMVLMKKGGKYEFEDADYVIEIPAPRLPQMNLGGNLPGQPTDPNKTLYGYDGFGNMQATQNQTAYSYNDEGVLGQNPTTQNNASGIVELPNQSEELSKNISDFGKTYGGGEKIDENQLSENISNFGKTYGGVEDPEKDKTSKLTLEEQERVKLYNPYSSYDTRAAAHTLGRAIGGQENAATGAVAGLKIGASLLRDTMSGFGSANRESYMQDEYDEKQAKDMRSFQAGGEISYEDVMEIRNATGIDFNEDFAQSYFTKMSPDSGATSTNLSDQVNLGKYKDVGYFDVTGKQGDTIMLNTTDRNPHNAQTIKQLERELMKLNPDQKLAVNYAPKKQDGGSIEDMNFTNTQFLREINQPQEPRNFTTTNPPTAGMNPQLPQREEYIRQLLKQYSEGQKTEEDILNEITPKMQKGGKLSFAEKMTGEYEQGLPENKEGQAVVEVEQGEHILQPDGTTSEVVGNKHSKGGAKLSADQIQDGSIVISDHLKIKKDDTKYFKEKYDIKVSTKDTYATVIDKIKKNIGIEKVTQEQEDVFKKIEKEEKNTKDVTTKNLNLEYLSKKVKELEEEKAAIEPQRLEAMQDVYGRQEASKPQEEQAQEQQGVSPELLQQLSQESGMPVEQLQEFLKGGKVKKYQDAGEVELEETDEDIRWHGLPDDHIVPKDLQAFINKFGLSGRYATNNRKGDAPHIGQGRIDEITKYLEENPHLSRYFTFVKNDSQVGDYYDVTREYIKDTAGITGFTSEDWDGDRDIAADFSRRPFNNFELKDVYTAEEIDNLPPWVEFYKEDFFTINTDEEGKTESFRPTQALQDRYARETRDKNFKLKSVESVADPNKMLTQKEADRITARREERVLQEDDKKTKKEKPDRTERNFPLFPDQGVLPPSSPQLPLKSQIRLGRADSVNVSPEAALVESARQRQAAMGALDTLPPAQKAAMLAMLTAQEGVQSNQAINQTAIANAQQDAQTQQFNIGQADREGALEAQNALSYEDRTFRTQAAYRENLNQYYDFLRKVNAQNFQDVRNQNTVNTIFEGYQIQPDGTLKYVGDTDATVKGSAPQNT